MPAGQSEGTPKPTATAFRMADCVPLIRDVRGFVAPHSLRIGVAHGISERSATFTLGIRTDG